MRSYPSWLAGLEYPGLDGTDRAAYCATLKRGSVLSLVPEPSNPYDANAVAIFHESNHIGYIPKRHAWVSASIAEGDTIRCTVSKVEREAGRATRVGLKIAIVADGDGIETDDFEDEFGDSDDFELGDIDVHAVAASLLQEQPTPAPRRSSGRKVVFVGVAVLSVGIILAVGRYQGTEQRRDYAAQAQKSFMALFPDVIVAPAGMANRTLRVSSGQLTKAQADSLRQSIPSTFAKLGFERIVFSDSTSEWPYDLSRP